MSHLTLEYLTEQLELGEQLLVGRDKMFEPQDLPGRYGRVVHAVDRLLQVLSCGAVLAGGCSESGSHLAGGVGADKAIVVVLMHKPLSAAHWM